MVAAAGGTAAAVSMLWQSVIMAVTLVQARRAQRVRRRKAPSVTHTYRHRYGGCRNSTTNLRDVLRTAGARRGAVAKAASAVLTGAR